MKSIFSIKKQLTLTPSTKTASDWMRQLGPCSPMADDGSPVAVAIALSSTPSCTLDDQRSHRRSKRTCNQHSSSYDSQHTLHTKYQMSM